MKTGKWSRTSQKTLKKKVRYGILGICAVLILGGITGCGSPACEPGSRAEESGNIAEAGSGTEPERPGDGLYTDGESGSVEKPPGEMPGNESGTENPEDTQEELNLTFRFASGETALAGFPGEVQDQAARINAGESLYTVLGLEELEMYSALVGTHVIIAEDKDSGEEGTGKGKMTMYVPNLLGSLQDVSVLFYDNADETWKILPIEKLDTDAKTVTMILTGSGIMTVIYRREG